MQRPTPLLWVRERPAPRSLPEAPGWSSAGGAAPRLSEGPAGLGGCEAAGPAGTRQGRGGRKSQPKEGFRLNLLGVDQGWAGSGSRGPARAPGIPIKSENEALVSFQGAEDPAFKQKLVQVAGPFMLIRS